MYNLDKNAALVIPLHKERSVPAPMSMPQNLVTGFIIDSDPIRDLVFKKN
jgi:hypothetical protein